MTHNLRLRALPALIPADGKDAEFRRFGEWLQWRVEGGEWQNLVPLSAIKGDPGEIGPSTKWRSDGGYLQSAPEGTDDWQDIVSLADITGPEGGINYRGAWEPHEYEYNSIVEHNGSLWYAVTDTDEEPSNSAADWTLFMPGSGVADGTVTFDKLAPDVYARVKNVDLSDVHTLLSNTSLQYGNGAGQVQAGDVVQTRKESFIYRVAPQDASDWHVMTAGGVKLYIAKGQIIQPQMFGASPDASAEVNTEAFRALARAVNLQGGGRIYIGGGTFTVFYQPINPNPGNGQPYYLWGDLMLFDGCSGVHIVFGENAKLVAADGVRYGSFDPLTGERYDPPAGGFTDQAYRVGAGTFLSFVNTTDIEIIGPRLDGNARNYIHGGYWGWSAP